MRWLILALVAATALAGCSSGSPDAPEPSGPSDTTTDDPPPPGSAARTVVAEAGGVLRFDPHRIEVPAGTDVHWTFANQDSIHHDLTVDAADFQLAADGGETATGVMDGLPAGEYEFYCSVPGHRDAGMWSTLVVT